VLIINIPSQIKSFSFGIRITIIMDGAILLQMEIALLVVNHRVLSAAEPKQRQQDVRVGSRRNAGAVRLATSFRTSRESGSDDSVRSSSRSPDTPSIRAW